MNIGWLILINCSRKSYKGLRSQLSENLLFGFILLHKKKLWQNNTGWVSSTPLQNYSISKSVIPPQNCI